MKILSRTRQLYKKILETRGQSEDDLLRSMERGKHLENLTKHPGYKLLTEFMDKQQEGTHAFMEQEAQKGINVIGLAWLFNAFVKYLFFLQENRAYNKVRTFIKVTIENGEKSRQKLAKREAQRESK